MNTIWIWDKKISKDLINVWSLQFLWICSKNKLCSLIKPHNYALCVPKEFGTLYEKVLRQNLRALYSTLILLVTYFLFKIIDYEYVAWEIHNVHTSNSFWSWFLLNCSNEQQCSLYMLSSEHAPKFFSISLTCNM